MVENIKIEEVVKLLKIKIEEKSEKTDSNKIQMHCPNKSGHKNADANASLVWFKESQSWKCFGCGRGGKLIDLVMLAKKCSKSEATAWLHKNFSQSDEAKPSKMVHCRYINDIVDSKKGRYISLKNPSLRQVTNRDINYIKITMNKQFSIDGFSRAKALMVDHQGSRLIAFPDVNSMIYQPPKPVGILVVEGCTDFLTLCSTQISNDYIIIGRRSKTAKFTLPNSDLPVYVFLDPDANMDDFFGNCLNSVNNLRSSSIYAINLFESIEVKDPGQYFGVGLSEKDFINLINSQPKFDRDKYYENNVSENKLPFCFWGDNLKLIFVQFWDVIKAKGFKLVVFDGNRLEPVLMRIVDNVATEFNVRMLQNWVCNELINELPDEFDGFTREDLKEKIARCSHMISQKNLNILPFEEVEFNRDTRDESFLYFRNTAVKVSKDGKQLVDYKDLPSPIFDKQIIDKEFVLGVDFSNFSYYKFLQNLCKPSRENDYIDEERFNALRSSIGYLLHKFVNPEKQKLIIFTENNISSLPKGRTGKGLILEGVKHLINVISIDGKKFDPKKEFAFQRVDRTTNLIMVKDVPQGFPLENMFSMITDGLTLRKMYQAEQFLEIKDAPKIVFDSNYSIEHEQTSSFLDRIYEMETFTRYSDSYKPAHELGEIFFSDSWNQNSDEGWNKFYNLMIDNLQFYFRNDLIKYRSDTLKIRALRTACGEEAIEFFEVTLLDLPYFETPCSDYYNMFLDSSGKTAKEYSVNKFGRAVGAYCIAKGLIWEAKTQRVSPTKVSKIYRFNNPQYTDN